MQGGWVWSLVRKPDPTCCNKDWRSWVLQLRPSELKNKEIFLRVNILEIAEASGLCMPPFWFLKTPWDDRHFPFFFLVIPLRLWEVGDWWIRGTYFVISLCPKRLLWLWIFLILFHNLHFWAPSWMCHSLKPKLVTILSFLSVVVQSESESVSFALMSDSLWPHRLHPTRLLCPWNSPGKNTGVGSHSLLQGSFPIQGLNLGLLHCMQILYHLSCQGSLHHCSKPSLNEFFLL